MLALSDSLIMLLRAESRGMAGGAMLSRFVVVSEGAWGIELEEGMRAAVAGALGRTGLKRELPLGGTRLGLVGPELPGEGPRYMLLTRAAAGPNSEVERR